MLCPSCGRDNASDRVECAHCEALLVDVFDSSYEKTDPMLMLGSPSAAESGEESESGDEFTRLAPELQYSGDLPRLFRFGNRYQVLEKLGEGGMGRVYKALDLELDRPIALKTIRTERGRGPEVLKRFKQELILARKITHRNVVRIYDLGEAEGMKFFTMELVEGESLRDVLRERKRVSVREAVSLMKQMLEGLSEAHRQGIVHRDLKPQNIMMDREGVLRIMDFGIARSADTATLTGSAEMMGTPDYISPEQVKGETANAQADLYSAGVILYELLTGDVPFKGDTAISKVVARLQVKPAAPRTLNPEIPAYLERIILKLMEVDPDLRYKTAQEVLQDLEREQVDRSLPLRLRKAIRRRRGWIAAACLVGALVAAVRYGSRRTEPVASADVPVTALAILPFHNMAGNPELAWMENGIPEMLITDISQLRALRPVLGERIHRILRELGKVDQSRFDEQTVQLISQSAGADYSLYGSFVESQGKLRMDLILRESDTGVGSPIKIDGASTEIFGLIDEITTKLSRQLDLDASRETDRPFHEVSTSSLPALRSYYQARSALQDGANQAAIPLLQRAVQEDPRFAMAHALLAGTFFDLGDRTNALAAIAAAESLSEESPLPLAERYQIHAISARIHDDPETAVASYRELAKLFPDDPDILQGLARSLETSGVVAEAIDVYRRVLRISPQHGAALLGLGRMLVVNGQPQEAVPLLEGAIASGHFENDAGALGMIHSILGVGYRDMARYEDAIRELQHSLTYRRESEDTQGVATSLSNLAAALRRVGRIEEARRHLNEALQLGRDTNNKTMESLALLNLGNLDSDSGEFDSALENYRKSLDIEWERNEHTELAIRLNSIAEVLRKRGLLADALVYLELARSHLEEAEDPIERAFNLRVLATIERARGDYESAQVALLESIRLVQKVGGGRFLAETHLLLAGSYADQGRFDEALQSVAAAMAEVEEPLEKPLVQLYRAEIHLELGEAQRGSEDLAESEKSLERLKYYDRLRLRLLRARALRLSARTGEAARELQDVLRRAEVAELVDVELPASVELGWILLETGRRKEALDLLRRVHARSSERRLRPIQANACLALASGYWSEGDAREAERFARELVELAGSFQGRVLLAEGNHLLALIADAEKREDDAARYRASAKEATRQLMQRIPPDLTEAFSRRFPWAGER